MMIIIFKSIPYSILSILLSNLNRHIRLTEKKMESILPGKYADGQRHYYELYLSDLKSRRDTIMKEIYRRAEWVEFEVIDKGIYLKWLKPQK